MRYEGRRKGNGANKVYVAKVLSQFGCGSSQLPFVDELFLDKMCRKKFRRNSGDVWIFAKKVRDININKTESRFSRLCQTVGLFLQLATQFYS